MSTKIEWADEVWNPMTGCTKVSTGCKFCYAEKQAPRTFKGRPFTDVRFHQERLDRPRRWQKPRRVFVNSMSDLFHEDIPIDQILDVMRVIYQTPRHTFQVLTKRPERMREVMNHPLLGDILSTPAAEPMARGLCRESADGRRAHSDPDQHAGGDPVRLGRAPARLYSAGALPRPVPMGRERYAGRIP